MAKAEPFVKAIFPEIVLVPLKLETKLAPFKVVPPTDEVIRLRALKVPL